MKLDRLKEISASWDHAKVVKEADVVNLREVLDALPGLLRVCDAYQELLTVGAWPERLAEKKLEELLG